ncbi:MAG: RecQ family ATP-dependent DNA helicase [Moraxellaceae bacterium]|nr:MAG: RecQ family ATP-dependent DNA helicase [Moraxellaceae bacterium]
MEKHQQLLTKQFGLQNFRPGQEEVIKTLLEGRSSLAVFPTGGGKSLCYQLPALLLSGLTLVVSPLIALMKDQVDQLQKLGIAAARLDSSLDKDQVLAVYQGIKDQTLKLLYVSPERLTNERFLSRLKPIEISLMAVDEAHCISEWGHNFRPDYLKLSALVQSLDVQCVLALTATATPAVSKEICERFAIKPKDFIQTGFYRPNLSLMINPCSQQEKNQALLKSIRQGLNEPTIVYVTLQKTAQQVADFLCANGVSASPYHAGLKDERRYQIQDDFMGGQCNTIVATIAFGMGIDKANIRTIIHYNLPKSLENYMQEVGRAGRDGLPSRCELMGNADDLTVLENFIYGDTPDSSSLSQFISHLLTQEDVFDLSSYELANRFDLRNLVLTTLLTYLELEGVICATAPFYSEYKIRFREPQAELLNNFDPQRKDFLERVFATGKQGRSLLTITPKKAAVELEEDPQRIIKALNYLDSQGWVELKVAGLRQGYRLQDKSVNGDQLTEKMFSLFQAREARDINRLTQMCDWINTPDCHQHALLQYFGEALPTPCGQCSGCTQDASIHLQSRTPPQIDTEIINKIQTEHFSTLSSPRKLTRFLCGISSPHTTRSKLNRDSNFGCMVDTPFASVLAACESMINSGSAPSQEGVN